MSLNRQNFTAETQREITAPPILVFAIFSVPLCLCGEVFL